MFMILLQDSTYFQHASSSASFLDTPNYRKDTNVILPLEISIIRLWMTRSSKTHHFAPSSVESTTTSYILSLPSLSPPFLIQTPPPLLASHEKFRCHPARQLFHLRHLFFNINDDKQSSSVLVETSENPIDSHQTQSSEPTIDQSDSSYELSIALKKSSPLICNPSSYLYLLEFSQPFSILLCIYISLIFCHYS